MAVINRSYVTGHYILLDVWCMKRWGGGGGLEARVIVWWPDAHQQT